MDQIDIKLITPYPKNAKKHPRKQILGVANSIKEFGFNQPIVVDKDNVIIVGHGRYEASQYLGLNKVPFIKVDLTEDQAKAYRLADNKLNESSWDMDLVIEELKNIDIAMMRMTGFDEDLLLDVDSKDDQMPEEVQTRAKKGDVWLLGGHKVMCGDSTSEKDVNQLMNGEKAQMCFTDPPYNIDYKGGVSFNKETGKVGFGDRSGIMNDKMSKEDFYKFLLEVSKRIIENVIGGVYICMSSSELDSLKNSFEEAGGHWQTFIIWVKNNFTLSRADYQHTYEPILYGWSKGIKNHYFVGDRGKANVWEDLRQVKTEYKDGYTEIKFQGYRVRIEGKITKGEVIKKRQRTDIWRYDKPSRSTEHPTMKPVALCEEGIKGSSKKEDVVLDLFLGSGSTLIACEKMNRYCYGMELDPKYVDVIITRWENYTGRKAKLKK